MRKLSFSWQMTKKDSQLIVIFMVIIFIIPGNLSAEEAKVLPQVIQDKKHSDPITQPPESNIAENRTSSKKESQDLDVFALSLEELMSIEVISATRTPGQDVFSSPAAIYVITPEDISRSGLLSLPELMRMVPGVHVGQIDGNKWAITARGLNDRFGRMMLVQTDGRTIYSPEFSGVYWEAQDMVFQDLERIEVIRGPGGTLWGANAVHGIINIVSKPAHETQGTLVSGNLGTEERGSGTVRYGGKLDSDTFFRVHAKHTERDKTDTYGTKYDDDTELSSCGFRIDHDSPNNQMVTLQGDYYNSSYGSIQKSADLATGTNPILSTDVEMEGGNVLGRWCRGVSEISDMQLQMYYDWNVQEDPHPAIKGYNRTGIFDLDFQHNLTLNNRHKIVWGIGYRMVRGHFRDTPKTTFDPSSRSDDTYSGFIQDSITLIPDCLEFFIGTKLEDNDYTGFEYQPNARLVWTPTNKHVFWSSIARSVRVPNYINKYLDFIVTVLPVPSDSAVRILGNRDMDAEEILAYELGYRVQLTKQLSLDIATFFNEYDNAQSASLVNPNDPLTLRWNNDQEGESKGVELSVNWQVVDQWRLSPAIPG